MPSRRDRAATRSEAETRESRDRPAECVEAPYGSWRSPITAAAIARGAIQLDAPVVCGPRIYWIEQRPADAGRSVLMVREPNGEVAEVLPADFDTRSRVHEYGGGAFAVLAAPDGGPDQIAASHAIDGCVYLCRGRAARWEELRRLTPEGADLRFGDLAFDAAHARLVCVRERHDGRSREPRNDIVALPLEGLAPDPGEAGGQVLASGADFYAHPCAHPTDGTLAYVCWNHPNMAWDATELHRVAMDPDGRPADSTQIAGGPGESVLQPTWSPQGVLHYVSDRTGWWNLHRCDGPSGDVALCPLDADFAQPPWRLGSRDYAFADDGRIVCRYTRHGLPNAAWLEPGGTATRRPSVIDSGFADFGCPQPIRIDGEVHLVWHASGARSPDEITLTTDRGEMRARVRSSSTELELDAADVSVAESIWFPAAEAKHEGARTHAFFYRPTNARYVAPVGERPPLVVIGHGGPTSATSRGFALGIQFFTSRGFAVVDVDYGGSTGYGRAYRERLRGRWGVVDVADCVGARDFLVERGDVDPERVAIRGRSAGGYTTLCALTFTDRFQAGASSFGIGDLMALVRETHKLESRYVDGLIGPLPECESLYRERSPIHHVDRLRTPMILFQGEEDRVVPPGQADEMARALDEKGLPVAYLRFAGEAHGFRRSETIERALEAELYFYGRVLGFVPADEIEPIEIRNLP